MSGRLSSSWELMKSSLRVIRADKELLMFPVLSGIIMAFIGLTFIGGIFLSDLFEFAPTALIILLIFVLYLLLYFIGIYFNTALIGCATIRLEGGDPTLKDGFRTANKNLRAIAGWAVIAAIVGIILRALEERAGMIGKIVISLIGFAWTMATFFIVPVLIYENLSVFTAIKRSAYVFKDTWGETFIGYFGLGVIIFLLCLIGVIPVLMGLTLGGLLTVIGLALAVVYWIFIACVGSAAQGVLTAALYRYATTGKISHDVVPEHLLNPYAKGQRGNEYI